MINRITTLLRYFFLFVYYKSIRPSEKIYDVIFKAVQDLGGVYIKLIQFVCLRTDVFPNEQKIQFLSFYDEVPVQEIDIDKTLIDELGQEGVGRFLSVEKTPFASGTFGQVYKGKLKEGVDVVIKVMRKDLIPKMRIDFFLLRILSRVFGLFYYEKLIDVPKLVAEFETATYEELDYKKEAKNAQYFYEMYVGHPSVFIPKTYLNLTTDSVLVQEYVPGIPVTDLIRFKEKTKGDEYSLWLAENYKTDMKKVISDIAFELAMQGCRYDKFYADPHPGNIKILPNNHFAFIDFGIIGKSPTNRRNYYNIVKLMIQRADELDMKALGKEFLEWGAHKFYKYIETLDYHFSTGNEKLTTALTEKYMQLLDSRREKYKEIEVNAKENFVGIYVDIIKTGQFLNVQVPEGMLAAMKSVVIYKSWNTFLEPEYFHMRETYRRVIESIDPDTLINEEASEKEVTIEEAVEGFLDWVGRVAETDIPFYNRLKSTLGTIAYV